MPSRFQYVRRVEFADTDMAGIAHFSSFFRYIEEAEHAFLRSLGRSVITLDAEGKLSWPRVSVHCDYRGPARFEDLLDVELRVARKGTSSLTYRFHISHAGRPVADAEMTIVYCRFSPDSPPKSVPIPADLSAQLEVCDDPS